MSLKIVKKSKYVTLTKLPQINIDHTMQNENINISTCKCDYSFKKAIGKNILSDPRHTVFGVLRWFITTASFINHFESGFLRFPGYYGMQSVTWEALTHWGRDKMAAISQTMFSNVFSWMEIYEFRLKFHWSLFLRVQLTIFQLWFR